MRTKTPSHVLGIIGLGYWGEKILRASYEMGASIVGTDADPNRLRRIHRLYPRVECAPTTEEIFQNPKVASCIIATPPDTHFALAKQSLISLKHTLVEKPMTTNVRDAAHLERLAQKYSCILMVDHIYLFSPAIMAIRTLIRKNAIGSIQHIISIRDTGRKHPRSSVLWDLVPHDISIASLLLDSSPIQGRTLILSSHSSHQIEDAVYQIRYPLARTLQGTVRWNAPIKKRVMEIVGTSGAIHAEWTDKTETYSLYTKKIQAGQYAYTQKKLITLNGSEEPIKRMLRHFIQSTKQHSSPLPDGRHAKYVIRAISALERSAHHNGEYIRI